ncbi:hypothetical protein ACK8OR_04525 [Jannaschia sp. KMU-145]|uniref:hypothetical protein n=1 Tax=Jannaschia halovivens TaxID=3388667 RepID=UPI00396B0CBC
MILLNLIIGILTGLAVPRMERWIKDWSESLWLGDMPISPHEFDLAALLVILMLAAVVCAILGIDSSAFLLALGALLGLFGKRIWARIQRGEP